MLYLFCSAAAPLYKRDALECISYPSGHVFRFRYQVKYVQPEVLSNLQSFLGADALLVFLDTVDSPKATDFSFLPLRMVTIARMEVTAGALYIDFNFGEFVNYATSERRDAWDRFFKGLSSRPWPPGVKSGENPDGRFVLAYEISPPDLSTECSRPYDNWNSVVNQLDKTKDLADSTFCLILGFFEVQKDLAEKKLGSVRHGFDSIYPIPMGKSVVLKTLLARPSFDYLAEKNARALTISNAGDVFAGMSKNKIVSESRYNEDRTVFVCKRVFDTVLAIVSIEETNTQEVRSPRLTLLTRVRVPRLIIGIVVGGVALSALLLAMDADLIKFIATLVPTHIGKYLEVNSKAIAGLAKLFSPIPVGISAYVAFRKLPIK
jgi:hypothetical protein